METDSSVNKRGTLDRSTQRGQHSMGPSTALLAGAVFSLLLATSPALAWDNDKVHPGITQSAVQLADAPGPTAYCWCNRPGVPDPQCSYIDEGSVKEDLGFSVEWVFPPFDFSPSWDLSTWGDVWCDGLPQYSWQKHGYNPMTGGGWFHFGPWNALDYGRDVWEAAEQDYNDGDPGAAYFKLGRTCHLLEDMSSPAHAQTDFHGFDDDAEEWGKAHYPSGSYGGTIVRKPSTHGYSGLSSDNYDNFMKNMVWQTYLATTYQAELVADFGDVQPDSELSRMFPYPRLRYEHDWFWGDYWHIEGVGDFYYAMGPNNEWWECDSDPGYYYLENLDKDPDGSDWADPDGIVAAVRRVSFFDPISPGDDLDAKLISNNMPLVEIYANNLFPRADEWVAGLIRFFAETVDDGPPFVVSHRYGRSPGTNIYVIFSEDMNEATFSDATITVFGTSSGTHSCSYSFNHSTYELTINPNTNFHYSETVSVTIGTGVEDLLGQGLVSPYWFDFTIQDENPDPPSYIIITSLSLTPSTVEPYGTVLVSGFAEYDTGVPVPVATATIEVSEWDTWTAAVSNGAFSRYIQAPGNPSDDPIMRTVTVTVDDGEVTPGSDWRTLTILGGDGSSGYEFDRSTSCVDKEDDPPYTPIDEKPAFSERDPQIMVWTHLEYLYVPVRVRVKWYDPSGNLYSTGYTDWTDDPQDYGHDYWYDWWFWSWRTGLCDYEGLWRCEVAVQPEGGSFEIMDTVEFTVRYNLTEHRMCEDVEGPPDYDPIGPRNVFYTDDPHAYTWAKFIYVSDPLDVKWVFYSPQGQYAEFTHTTQDPWGQGYDWYGWVKTWGWIDIDGASAEYQCGDWHVGVYVADCYGSYELKYTDAFQIFERPAIGPDVTTSATPDPVIETQEVQLNVDASDNNHLKKVVLHWNDGSQHTHTMADNIDSSTYAGMHSIGSFVADQQIAFWAEAWDESGNRGESSLHTIIVQPESVSVPDRPSGPAYRQVNEIGTYETGGSTTNLGNPVEYRFDWGDGTESDWGDASRSNSWDIEGFHVVRAQARSQVNPDRVSDWSPTLTVAVDSTPPIVEIATNDGVDFQTNEQQILLEGFAEDALAGMESVSISTGDVNEGTPGAWRFTVDLNPGPNPLTVTATDNAGNEADDTITVTYVPRLPLTEPLDGPVDPDDVQQWAPSGMVFIPGGEFAMGDPWNEGQTDERPVHNVYLSPFHIDTHEVTNHQYANGLNWAWAQGGLIEVIDGVVYKAGDSVPYCDTTTSLSYSRITWNGNTFGVVAGKEDHPMVGVSWYGSVAYCNWRSAMEGKPLCYDLSTWMCNFGVAGYRLPTEAEWEKAAGWDPAQEQHFRFGEHSDGCGYNCLDGQRANYSNSGDPYEPGASPDTTPVGFYNGELHDKADFGWPGSQQTYQTQSAQSYYGCYDLSGNVSEWCNDWYDSGYYGWSPYGNPRGPASGSYRVLRGGTWPNVPAYCRSATRFRNTPDWRRSSLGFRCAAGTP